MVLPNKYVVLSSLVVGMYFFTLLSVLADLWSGVRKAKKNKTLRSSFGYRRTVDKISRYYNYLFALSVVDAMQILTVSYLNLMYGYNIWLIPAFTVLGTLSIGLIEIKSVYEKAEDKFLFGKLGGFARKVAQDPKNVENVMDGIEEFFENPENQENKTSP